MQHFALLLIRRSATMEFQFPHLPVWQNTVFNRPEWYQFKHTSDNFVLVFTQVPLSVAPAPAPIVNPPVVITLEAV